MLPMHSEYVTQHHTPVFPHIPVTVKRESYVKAPTNQIRVTWLYIVHLGLCIYMCTIAYDCMILKLMQNPLHCNDW